MCECVSSPFIQVDVERVSVCDHGYICVCVCACMEVCVNHVACDGVGVVWAPAAVVTAVNLYAVIG